MLGVSAVAVRVFHGLPQRRVGMKTAALQIADSTEATGCLRSRQRRRREQRYLRHLRQEVRKDLAAPLPVIDRLTSTELMIPGGPTPAASFARPDACRHRAGAPSTDPPPYFELGAALLMAASMQARRDCATTLLATSNTQEVLNLVGGSLE